MFTLDSKPIDLNFFKEEHFKATGISASDLHIAARYGTLTDLQNILEESPALLNSQDSTGETALHYALRGQHFEAFSFLAGQKADPNIANQSGQTPLHVAAERNLLNFCQKLIENDAAINAQDNQGNTPFHLAIQSSASKTIVFFFGQNRACMETKNRQGKTPLDLYRSKLEEEREIISQENSSNRSQPSPPEPFNSGEVSAEEGRASISQQSAPDRSQPSPPVAFIYEEEPTTHFSATASTPLLAAARQGQHSLNLSTATQEPEDTCCCIIQ